MKVSLLKIGVGIILLIFTLFAFVIKQPCDIDKVYLWCRVHPLSVLDIFGLLLFYGGAFLMMGFIPLSNEQNSSKWNFILFGAMALGIILIWV